MACRRPSAPRHCRPVALTSANIAERWKSPPPRCHAPSSFSTPAVTPLVHATAASLATTGAREWGLVHRRRSSCSDGKWQGHFPLRTLRCDRLSSAYQNRPVVPTAANPPSGQSMRHAQGLSTRRGSGGAVGATSEPGPGIVWGSQRQSGPLVLPSQTSLRLSSVHQPITHWS